MKAAFAFFVVCCVALASGGRILDFAAEKARNGVKQVIDVVHDYKVEGDPSEQSSPKFLTFIPKDVPIISSAADTFKGFIRCKGKPSPQFVPAEYLLQGAQGTPQFFLDPSTNSGAYPQAEQVAQQNVEAAGNHAGVPSGAQVGQPKLEDVKTYSDHSQGTGYEDRSLTCKISSLNHSACAAHCIIKGNKGGHCKNGICHCRN